MKTMEYVGWWYFSDLKTHTVNYNYKLVFYIVNVNIW